MGLFSKGPRVTTSHYPMCFTSGFVPVRNIKQSFSMIRATTAEISGSYKSEKELTEARTTKTLTQEMKKKRVKTYLSIQDLNHYLFAND